MNRKGSYYSVKLRRIRVKLAAVSYKGGKCERCGYNNSPYALEFHHRNPEDKSFGIAASTHNKSWDKIKEELDKCEIVCSNCHQEEHGIASEGMIIEAIEGTQHPEMIELLHSLTAKTHD